MPKTLLGLSYILLLLFAILENVINYVITAIHKCTLKHMIVIGPFITHALLQTFLRQIRSYCPCPSLLASYFLIYFCIFAVIHTYFTTVQQALLVVITSYIHYNSVANTLKLLVATDKQLDISTLYNMLHTII